MRMTKTWVLLVLCQALAACAPMVVDSNTVPDFPRGALAKPTLECVGNCKIDVFARINADGRCEVLPEYDAVRVPARKTPKMTWRIESLMPAKTHDFRFEFDPATTPPRYGIEILRNDPSKDFDDPGYDKDFIFFPNKMKFKWQNKHERPGTFDYNIVVSSSPRDKDTWSPCKPLDPRIIND